MNIPKKNWLEWAVFGVSLALVLAMFGFLVQKALTMGDSPPDLQVTLGQPVQQAHGFAVPVEVENQGDETAENVMVEVELTTDGQTSETSELTLGFVPHGSSADGWAVFEADPATGKLDGRVLGYEQP